MTEDALARLQSAIAKAQGRWPSGAPGGKGGQFAPKGAASHSSFADLFSGKTGGPSWKDGFGDFGGSHGSGYSQPAPKKLYPAGAKKHPKKNDAGETVIVDRPSKATGADTWSDPEATARFTPASEVPASLNGIPVAPWKGAPTTIAAWKAVGGQRPELDDADPITPVEGKSVGSGVIIQESDGRIWLTNPTNQFGGYKATFPKGTLEPGLSLQAGAIKEAFEETGLQVEITGVVGDFERSTSVARYYFARRVGGSPKEMGWESQSVELVPLKSISQALNMPVDREIAAQVELIDLIRTVDRLLGKARPRPLYVQRKVVNAAEIIAWAKGQGFKTTLPAEDLHVTIAYCRTPVDWLRIGDPWEERVLIHAGGARIVDRLGPKQDASVLIFSSRALADRHDWMRQCGASWDWAEYQPHITISYDPEAPRPEVVEPFRGRILLGPELFEPLNEDWKASVVEKAAKDQERWPAGSPLGGQWKGIGPSGFANVPKKIGSAKNPQYAKLAEAAHALALAGDINGLGAMVAASTAKVMAAEEKGQKSSHVKWTKQVLQFQNDLLVTAIKGPKVEAAAARVSGPAKLSAWTKTGGKPGGSNPGAIYKDEKGAAWLVKGNLKLQQKAVTQAQSNARASNEVLAAKLMAAAGAGAPKMKLVELEGQFGGGLGVASKMIDGVTAIDPKNKTHLAAVRADFAIQAWLGNYDALGMGMENTVLKDGAAINIDPGGALLFRAQGLPKGEFSAEAPEWESMRVMTPQQKAIYGTMTASELQDSAARLSAISDETIKELVGTYGKDLTVPGGGDLAEIMIARRDAILKKAGVVAVPVPGVDGAKMAVAEAFPVQKPVQEPVQEPVAPSQTPAQGLPEVPVMTGAKAHQKVWANFAAAAQMHFEDGNAAGLKAVIDHAASMPGENPAATKEYAEALLAQLDAKAAPVAAQGVVPRQAKPKPAPAMASKPSAPDFAGYMIDQTNSNAPSNNKKVAAIKAAFEAGDADAILAMGYGSNTYGKKQAKLANDALAALGSDKTVTSPQPQKKVAAEKPAAPVEPKPAIVEPTPAAAPVYRISQALDFQNWNGPGKGLSSKPAVNAQNSALAKEIEALGKQQKVAELKAMTFDVLDAAGNPTGQKKPIAEHPSQHIKNYHADVIRQATTPYIAPKKMTDTELAAVPDAVKSIIQQAPKAKKLLESSKRVGRYAVLAEGIPDPFEGFPPVIVSPQAKNMDVSALYAESQKNFESLTKIEKQAIRDYTGSDFTSQNNAETGEGSTKASHTIKGLKQASVTLPTGSVLSRKFSFSKPADLTAFLKSQGSVIQDFGIISTSTNPGTWNGSVHLRIVTAPGVKGLYVAPDPKKGGNAISKHPSKNEIILPYGTRFYVRKVTKSGSMSDKAGNWGSKGGGMTIVELVALPDLEE